MNSLQVEPKLFFEDVRYNLSEIRYTDLDSSKFKAQIKITDKHEVNSVSKNEIVLTMDRKITTFPDELFELEIKVKMNLPLNQKENKFTGSINDLKEYVNKNFASIVNNSNAMETISLLVSQITSTYAKVPIITPPVYVIGEEKK